MEVSKARILLAEDDENLGMLLKEYMQVKGYEIDLFPNGEKAFAGFQKAKYDICILDVMMPIKDGITLAKEIRMLSSAVPILFLTAKSVKEDVLEGFAAGADDYMTKPFSIEELLFRVEAILRRTRGENASLNQDTFQVGIYSFNSTKQTLLKEGGEEQKLTAKESELLRQLCINRNAVLDRNFALKTIWNDDTYFNARSMDVYITKLRKFLKEDPSIQIINVRGKGFKLIG
ncbi:MAG: response regulator transcription factor [Prevotellaceae bacterium]|jgi:DNA-binding response OmpR family regulator|nr:response regulator transcription factor [Prevotellaceae bacterium]